MAAAEHRPARRAAVLLVARAAVDHAFTARSHVSPSAPPSAGRDVPLEKEPYAIPVCRCRVRPRRAARPRPRRAARAGGRGASGLAPEHTFAAYDLALKQGADYIEQDLQQAADGTLVVIQDATLDRTARGPAENCIGLVVEKTLEQLKTWDLGSWFNETKNPDDADHVEERLVALLDEYNLLRGAAERWQVLVQSFSPDSLLRLQ
ncbi:MAG TPA: glycerophosphodiester phosphodiesterase family protein, partial [Solirubrobacteraceae bacterium]|nr:glycerophosphodiester phosphodiesterase family protein [Solirubrobacteraceae bacterium]